MPFPREPRCEREGLWIHPTDTRNQHLLSLESCYSCPTLSYRTNDISSLCVYGQKTWQSDFLLTNTCLCTCFAYSCGCCFLQNFINQVGYSHGNCEFIALVAGWNGMHPSCRKRTPWATHCDSIAMPFLKPNLAFELLYIFFYLKWVVHFGIICPSNSRKS